MRTPTLERPNRDAVTTIRSDGSRRFLYPADVRGRFARARRLSAALLIACYLLLPWWKINGYPAVFLDLVERRFHLFGFTLAAQDMWLMFFLITGVGFSLFFVTALLGRIWCGWACPQTVFLDHVYRRIERWTEGDALRRRNAAQAPLNAAKVGRRMAKHALYLLASALITHLFLAYFVSLPEVWSMMRSAPAENWSTFLFVAVATAALYFNFAWFREQLCIVICPYGRMQSALIDDDTLVIGYDNRRGEPRGRVGTTTGDCIDCTRSVQVCPTGIDIRQGLQMECIGCTACIDACDDVMRRLRRPVGLIRYDSQSRFAGRKTRWMRPRTLFYFFLFAVGIVVTGAVLLSVKPANLSVTRMTGAPYIVDPSNVRNQFLVRIVNKRNEPVRFVLSTPDLPPGVRELGFESAVEVPALGEVVRPIILQQARQAYRGPFRARFLLSDAAGTFKLEREIEFVGPEPRLLREEE